MTKEQKEELLFRIKLIDTDNIYQAIHDIKQVLIELVDAATKGDEGDERS